MNPRFRRAAISAVATLASVLTLGIAGPAAADEPAQRYPVMWNTSPMLSGLVSRALIPGWHPAGTNDPTCRLDERHPNPVVFVNFTTGSGWEWGAGAPYLRNLGYCTFSFNYGNITPLPNMPFQAVGDIVASAHELAENVDRILAETGAREVDLVGWSQGGGMTPHYYLNFLGGTAKVDDFVAIAPGNHGTTGSGLLTPQTLEPVFGPLLLAMLPAFGQQIEGSDLATAVYADGDTRPGVDYTTIVSAHDEVATPYTNQFLDGPGATNILLQDGCPLDYSEHLSIGFSRRTWEHVRNALDPARATPVACIPVAPFFGSPWVS